MNPLLGLRLAVSGGREQLLRRAFTATGVGVGAALLLLAVSAPGAALGRSDRIAWQDAATAVVSAETPDPPIEKADGALFLAVSDYSDGNPMTRAYVAALGVDPPVPPGLDRLPGPGEVAVSPAMRDLLAATPDDELDNRFPGRATLTIGRAGLAHQNELVAIVGRTPDELRGVRSVAEVHGFYRAAPQGGIRYLQAAGLGTGSVVVLLPVLVFLVIVTRVAAGQQERRLAMLRLVGATRAQTALVAATETGLAAVAGAALGWVGYELGRRVLAATVVFQGGHFWAEDVAVPGWALAAVLAGVPVLAILTTLASLRSVQVSPLAVGRRGRRPAPTAWTARPLGAGLAAQLALGLSGAGGTGQLRPILAVLQVVGVALVGPWLCLLAARAVARLSRRASALIAARRIAYDPRATFRAVGVVALAAMAATYLGSTADRPGPPAQNEDQRLRPGVVQINTGGVAAERVAPLLSAETVTERWDGSAFVVSCIELRRVRHVTCPHPTADPGGPVEPGLGAERFTVLQVYVPTDGSLAAENRVRTRTANLVPNAIINTDRDPVDYHLEQTFADFDRLGGVAALFVIILGACGLTAGVIAGLAERRRPFALLRASGVRLGELRMVVLVETAVTMLVTSAVGSALGLVAGYAATRGTDRMWTWPGLPVLAVIGAGMLAALAFAAFALPLVGLATRPDTVRYE